MRNTISLNKGAMFGLDARIALAIFGALSVISGAALFSTIQDAKVISFIAQANELNKAYTSYRLDTGEHLPQENIISLHGKDLIINNQNRENWQGPYWPGFGQMYDNTDILGRISFSGFRSASFVQSPKSTWGTYSNSPPAESCDPSNCHIWAYIEVRNQDISFAKKIDEKIDGVIDAGEGNVRVREFGDGTYNIYIYNQTK